MIKKSLNEEIAFHLKKLLDEFTDIEWAEDVAQQAHLNQYRRGTGKEPYIIHPKRVQLRAKSLGYGKDVQLLALLHDVMEDSKHPEKYGKKILDKFGLEFYNNLLMLSHDNNVNYNEYLLKLAFKSKLAFQVKMLDMCDNLLDSPTEKQFNKYKNAILFLLQNGVNKSMIPNDIFVALGLKKMSMTESILIEKDDKKNDEDSSKDEKEMDKGDKNNAVGDMNKSGGNIGGIDPFADDPADNTPKGDKQDNDDEQGESIVKYNEEVNKIKKIKYQNSEPEPGFDFESDDSVYEDGYVGNSIKGSLLLATPHFSDISDYSKNEFFKNSVLRRIYKSCKRAIESGKKIVFIGEYGNPVRNDMYQNNEQGIIAKFLTDKFGNNVSFDTWIPNEYKSFIEKDKIWKDLKQITKLSGSKIRSALYLYMLLLHGNDRLTQSLMSEKVVSVLQSWNIKPIDIDMSYKDSMKKIIEVLYPESVNKPQNEASFIMKVYYHLLMKDLIMKFIRFEKANKIAIVATSPQVAWELAPSVRNIDLILANRE